MGLVCCFDTCIHCIIIFPVINICMSCTVLRGEKFRILNPSYFEIFSIMLLTTVAWGTP